MLLKATIYKANFETPLFHTHQFLVSRAPSFCFSRTKNLFLAHQVFVSYAPSFYGAYETKTKKICFSRTNEFVT